MSNKTVIITESMANRLLNEAAADDVLKSRDFEKKVKDIITATLKDDKPTEKAMEKKIRKIVASCVNNLFRTLWMRRNFYEDSIKNDNF